MTNGISNIQIEILNEITKSAAIKAANAMSKLLEFPVGVDLIPVATKSVVQLDSYLSDNNDVVCLNIPLLDPLPGTCLLVYPEKTALNICDIMLKEHVSDFDDMSKSVLIEVANIVIGNFLTAFAVPFQIDALIHQNPTFLHGNYTVLFKDIVKKLSTKINKGLVVEVAFHFSNKNIYGTVIFLFDETKLQQSMHEVDLTH